MTLLLTVIASVTCTAIWYSNAKARELKVGTLCWMFWGASIMWFVDAVVEYLEIGAEFFEPSGADMLNDLYLGLSVVTLGLVIWIVVLLIKDPENIIRKTVLSHR